MTRRKSAGGKQAQEPKVLIGVRVPESFHKRILAECLRSGLSLQAILVRALEHLFRGPENYDYEVTSYVTYDSKLSKAEVNERHAALTLFVNYLEKMPREKRQVLAAAMEWDLRALKSSRIKPRRRKPQPPRRKE